MIRFRILTSFIPHRRIRSHAGTSKAQIIDAGVTVLLFDKGAKVGVDVSGGGPASRETHLADPTTADNPINAIVLAGGSAYGLAAADGVMQSYSSLLWKIYHS